MESPETGPNTLLRYEIQGDAAAIERLDLDPGFSVYGAIRASVPLYDRFFSAYPVVRSEGEPREILPPSVKLTDLVAAVDAIRSDTISLPNTGNAGLADPRLGLR